MGMGALLNMSNKVFDIAVIGAGPAGMSAALEAEKHGASVVLLDEQSQPGGQIYRNVLTATRRQFTILGSDYAKGAALAKPFSKSTVLHLAGVSVWQVTQGGHIGFSKDGKADQIRARHIIVATGATERPVPIPGWTLPGVLTAGAAQILLKSGGFAAPSAVLVGAGPLLYLVAAQMVAAGSPPKALVETQTQKDLRAALEHLGGALRGWRYLLKGLGLIAQLKRAGVQRYSAATEVEISGSDRAEAVSFKAKGRHHRIEAETFLVHLGVVPNTQITRSLRLEHRYDETQRCFKPISDAYGHTSCNAISIAGDGAGIGGAVVAALSGRIAALGALHKLEMISQSTSDEVARPLLLKREKELAIRPFLDTAYAPSEEILRPADGTIICRCEEVTAGDIRRFAALGCKGPNQAKAFGRSGMGPCQGRFCGLTVTEILAKETGQSQDETGAFRIRTPLKPVTLGELAAYEAE